MLINNLESTWRRLCTHQLKLGHKFTPATTQQLISTGWRTKICAYFPNHFVPLNQPAWGAKVLRMITLLSRNLFFMHCIYKRIFLFRPGPSERVFIRTISSMALQDWLHEERFDSTIPCLRADLMCTAWEDGWNEKFNSFSSSRFDIVFAFFLVGDVLFRFEDVTSLQGVSLLKYLKQDCLQMSSFVSWGWRMGRLYKTEPDGFLPFNAKQEDREKFKLLLHPTFGNLPARKVCELSLQISFFVRFKLFQILVFPMHESEWLRNGESIDLKSHC